MNKYKVWCPDDSNEEDARDMDAASVVDAAKKFGELYDSDGDYTIANGNDVNFLIKDLETGRVASIIVSGERATVYRARFSGERDFE